MIRVLLRKLLALTIRELLAVLLRKVLPVWLREQRAYGSAAWKAQSCWQS
jgi:hypothetical protein